MSCVKRLILNDRNSRDNIKNIIVDSKLNVFRFNECTLVPSYKHTAS